MDYGDENRPPYRRQDPRQVNHVVGALEEHTGKKKSGFSCRKSVFPVAGSNIKVTSWKLLDHDYKKPFLPTYARGLFTYKNSRGDYEIAVRGYDKFFNHGEVPKTKWQNVEVNTRGPYELSVKENGCIIFLSGLEDGTLLVCSKHSTGAREDVEMSHASAGEQWVDRHLGSVGKNRKDLARHLYNANITAVAELCDDEFEEHVLAYTPDQAGLYLHGVNLNLPEFATYPAHLVDKFAEDWGFKKTMHLIKDDIATVKSFLDDIADTGAYAGRDTEGFVIRCQARETPDSPWHDWFFKYKFEEPYLMYRQWRECTKAIISGKEPRINKHKEITQEYLRFAKEQLAKDPKLGRRYNQNHGIIELRDKFLKHIGVRGADLIKNEKEQEEQHKGEATRNVVLVPIATIGCGKTTVATALAKLFSWGHLQNDNIQGKGRPARFAEGIREGLINYPVMIADRNNHQKRERKQLINDVGKTVHEAKFVALHYVHDRADYDYIRQKMRDRVFGRGDKHQTIHAGTKGPSEIIEIMEGFMYRFEPLDPTGDPDDMFDHVIDLDVAADSRQNLETVITSLSEHYPNLIPTLPSSADMDYAISYAVNDYAPEIKHSVNGSQYSNKAQKQAAKPQRQETYQQPKQKPPKVEYFGVSLSAARVQSILEAIFRDADPTTSIMYNRLKGMKRIQPAFHVTLIHRANSNTPQWKDYWVQLNGLQTQAGSAKDGAEQPSLSKVKVQLERLVWDNRVMAFVVRIVTEAEENQNGKAQGVEFRSANRVAHVTVGTEDESIKPKESNDLLARWLEVGSGGETGIGEVMVKGHVELPGVVRAVMQRF
ncbi:RNA ligase-domain-containing protein [Elsinoe ampelina]|uniref:tRNA ligase n=1 Tax=Elsinoe ampelina TaxID=302913 RepID=A0A6A6GBP7_9PEZI|nr:RNA ligase-domain-containing protein [Elsinoe ampelina]